MIGFFAITILLLSRLYIVQIVNGESYNDRADRQYLRPNTSLFNRGSIVLETKDGEYIDAATLKTGYTVSLNPSIISNPEDIFNNLSTILNLEEDKFFKMVEKSKDPYEELAKRIDKETADKIEKLDLKGVSVFKERWRFYPGKQLAAQTLGFMSFKGDELSAQYGLERQYNDVLDKQKNNIYANFFVEIFSSLGDSLSGKDGSGSIVTTIEPTVQSFIEKEIENVRSKWSSDKVGIIVMNPKTGEIYAMAITPSFDLNEFNKVNNVSVFNNSLVEDVYEMGSIVKPLTVAIGLDRGVITPESTYEDKGQLTLDSRTFYNFDKKARGVVPMQEVLNQSLNTGVAYIVKKVGNDVFSDYMKKLLANKTNIDLPNEALPLVDNLDSPRDIEHATASFGQGIAMSPIAITRALATLGNGGVLVNPHLVKKIDYEVGIDKEIKFDEPQRIFKEETSETISRMLVTVVDKALLNGSVSIPSHTIAAKTGTAQIASNGGYSEYDFLHSFFGYFPAFDPQFIIFLYNVRPKKVQYASQTLTEPFMNITQFLINYYEIPPDR